MTAWFFEVVQLTLACSCFAVFVYLAARSAMAGAIIVLATFILFQATAPRLLDLVVQFGSVSVYPMDVTSLALLTVGAWRLVTLPLYGPAKIALFTMVFLLVANLLWGMAEFGVQQSTNGSRFWFAIVSGVVYGATVREWDRRLPTALIAAGSILACLSIIRVFQNGLYAATTLIDVNGESVDARPVMALGVLLMLVALILVFARGNLSIGTTGLALLLATGILLLQYRTLWVVAITSGMLGAFYVASRHRATNERVVYLLTAASLFALPTLLFALSQVRAYQESAESATGASSTIAWRVGAWKELLTKHSSPQDLVFGAPSGTDREIVVNGLVTNLSAHNLYVEAILQYGLVGLVTICALGAMALSYRAQSARALEIGEPAVVVVVVALLLVSMTHSPAQVEGLILGAFLSAVCYQTRPSSVRSRIDLRSRQLATSR